MSNKLNRRQFLRDSLAGSAAIASVLSFEEKALLAASKEAGKASAGAGVGGLPTGKIGNVTISRLICGGNLIGGWAHGRDLIYVSSLLKQYFTDEKIIETLQICEENGINTIIVGTSSFDVLKKYRDERGGKIQWLVQCVVKPDDLRPTSRGPLTAGRSGRF
jgi:hypothetical protein